MSKATAEPDTHLLKMEPQVAATQTARTVIGRLGSISFHPTHFRLVLLLLLLPQSFQASYIPTPPMLSVVSAF